MSNTINYRLADKKDVPAIIELLKKCKLPVADIEAAQISFIVAEENNVIVGCIGLEKINDHGLLRSFAVKPQYRNGKIGSQLYDKLIDFANNIKTNKLHLLTTTADNYFLKKGFNASDRNEAPAEIKATAEFSSLCPSSSVYMFLNLKNNF